MYRLEDNLLALCDCQKGCYNYEIVGNGLVERLHVEMINMEEVLVMKVTEGAPKLATIVVSSQNILALMRWGQD